MYKLLSTFCVLLLLSGCVVMPQNETLTDVQCSLSTSKKYLKVVDLTDGDTSFYEWQGEVMGLITMPTTAVISATYVVVNNIFNFGERQIKCNGLKDD